MTERKVLMSATQPIRCKSHVRKIVAFYLKRGQIRNHVLIVLGVYTGLRISDLLKLSWDDVYDFDRKCVKQSVCISEKKTGKLRVIAFNKAVVRALALFAVSNAVPDRALIVNPFTGFAISRIQAYRIVRAAADALAVCGRVSCHSLRKTFGYHVWKSGASPMVIMDIFNHSSLGVTMLYIGITQDDRDKIYMGLSFA